MLKIITTLAFFISSLIFGQNSNRSVSGLKSNAEVLKVRLGSGPEILGTFCYF